MLIGFFIVTSIAPWYRWGTSDVEFHLKIKKFLYIVCLRDFVSTEHYNKYQQYLARNTNYINMI